MTNGTVSSTIDSKYHRAKCPACGTTCGQRSRPVLLPGGDKHSARECIECEAIYVVGEPTAPRAPEPEPTEAERHQLLEATYGCVNCRISNPRHCAESGHLDCDAGKPDREPEEPGHG